MKCLACLLVMVAACGDNARRGDDELAVDLTVRPVATFAPEYIRGLAIAALDENRLAIARIDKSGEAFCPDCVDLDPSECPQLCERSTVSVSVLATMTGVIGEASTIATVFPLSYDHTVDQVEIVGLGGDRAGVGWLECDNATCMGLFAKRSCTARYATIDLTTGTLTPASTLYAGWFGDLYLAFNASTKQLLALVGKDLAFGAGIVRAIYDETGTAVLSPWAPLGSTAARSPAIVASGGEFVVVADDWSPTKPPLPTPCTESCDCLAAGSIELEAGGLFTFHVAASGDRSERVAPGIDDRGFYGRREQIAVIDAGGRLMIAGTQSIDRSAEIFTYDGVGWSEQIRTQAPIPTWIGALGTADWLAWIGAQPEPGEAATVQRLVAGVVAGTETGHATFTEPLDRHVFAAVPIATPQGVTTTYLLQGVFAPRMGDRVSWDRYELIAIDAAR